jgi:DNA-binding beta-propeller fold protein YncE
MADATDAGHRWPLASATARLLWLRAVCAVAEGADVPLSHATRRASSSSCPPDVCVAAALGDVEHRVAVLGGREGMPRSLGSVYAGSVTRFLGGAFRGVVSRVIVQEVAGKCPSWGECGGVAVSVDGCTLLVSDRARYGSHTIHEISAVDGSLRRVIGSEGRGPLQFREPYDLCIASDGFVFVADYVNNRVQVLTPTLDFHRFIGEGQLSGPSVVCASADVIVVVDSDYASYMAEHHVSVFDRGDGALLRRFAPSGRADGQLTAPGGLCFMPGHLHVAVAESGNSRVSVFNVDGEFIRHVGVGVLNRPTGVAASAFDELVVTDTGNRCLRVFSGTGDLLATVGDELFMAVAVRGSTVFAMHSYPPAMVSVFNQRAPLQRPPPGTVRHCDCPRRRCNQLLSLLCCFVRRCSDGTARCTPQRTRRDCLMLVRPAVGVLRRAGIQRRCCPVHSGTEAFRLLLPRLWSGALPTGTPQLSW